jgi:hypothetical protein
MRTTREPIGQIAIACGFCDQAHLCKLFRRMTGMTPSAWRRAKSEGSALAEGVDGEVGAPVACLWASTTRPKTGISSFLITQSVWINEP